MSDSDEARNRATRLLAIALKARELGTANSNELEQLANQALAQAEAAEAIEAAVIRQESRAAAKE